MRRRALILLAALLAAVSPAENLPFPAGEELLYHVTWNGIPVAWSRATVSAETLGGREVLALRIRTRTFSFFDHFFKVDDLHESLIDAESFRPIQYTKNLHEGDYRCHEITTFDYEKGEAHYEHRINGKEKTYPIDPETRDLVSFMYFMRAELLEENRVRNYRVMADEKVYDLIINTRQVEPIGLPNYERDVPSLKMVPEAMFDGLFVRKGKATVWISRDPRRLLTFAKVKVPFGRVRIRLHEVSGPGEDFWITELKDGEEHDE